MARRGRKPKISPEIAAAEITAEATTRQAHATRVAAYVGGLALVAGAIITGVCGVTGNAVTALPSMLHRPGTPHSDVTVAAPTPIAAPDAVEAPAKPRAARTPGPADVARLLETANAINAGTVAMVLAADCPSIETAQGQACRASLTNYAAARQRAVENMIYKMARPAATVSTVD